MFLVNYLEECKLFEIIELLFSHFEGLKFPQMSLIVCRRHSAFQLRIEITFVLHIFLIRNFVRVSTVYSFVSLHMYSEQRNS